MDLPCSTRRAWGAAAGLLLMMGCKTAPEREGAFVTHPSPGLSPRELGSVRDDLPVLSAAEVARRRSLGEPLAVIDVRTPGEREKLRIPGSLSLPYYELQSRLGEVPRDRPVVLYCGGGDCPLSRWAAQKLLDWGLTNVYELEGGIAEWRRRGYPTDSGPEPGPDKRQNDW